MSILKKVFIIAYSLLLCMMCLSSYVYAVEKLGSIELAFHNQATASMSFSIYKIGDVIDSSSIQYVPSTSFSKLNVDLNHISTAKDYETIINQCIQLINQEKIQSLQTVKGNTDGNVIFKDLNTGVYFIKQNQKINNFDVESLIVSLPFDANGELIYDVVANPKYNQNNGNTEITKRPIVHVKTNDETDVMPIIITMVISGSFAIIVYLFIKQDKKCQ